MVMTNRTQLKIITFILLAVVMLCGCVRSSPTPSSQTTTAQSSPQLTPESSPLTGFAKDLQYVKNGGFSYIWIFSRKDGKPLEKEDSVFLRTNAPQVLDWVITDGGKRVIAGTNFNLEEGNLAALKKRFVAEDYTGK